MEKRIEKCKMISLISFLKYNSKTCFFLLLQPMCICVKDNCFVFRILNGYLSTVELDMCDVREDDSARGTL